MCGRESASGRDPLEQLTEGAASSRGKSVANWPHALRSLPHHHKVAAHRRF